MPLAEATVTAYANSDFTGKLDDVTTTETGTFSLFVDPLSGTVYLKAEPRELEQADYSDSENYQNLVDALDYVWFDPPANRPGGSIAVIPGQTLQFGAFEGHSVQPRITRVWRDSLGSAFIATPPLTNGEPLDTIVVTWEFDTRNLSTNADDSYSVASGAALTLGGIVTAGAPTATDPAAYDGDADRTAGSVANGTSSTHKRTSTYLIPTADRANYGKRNITIEVGVSDADGEAATATSASAALDSVAHGATGVTVTRDGNATAAADAIAASWSGPGSPGLEHRIALEVEVDTDDKDEWVVVPSTPCWLFHNEEP